MGGPGLRARESLKIYFKTYRCACINFLVVRYTGTTRIIQEMIVNNISIRESDISSMRTINWSSG